MGSKCVINFLFNSYNNSIHIKLYDAKYSELHCAHRETYQIHTEYCTTGCQLNLMSAGSKHKHYIVHLCKLNI